MNKKYYKYIFTFLVLLSSTFLCLNSVKAEQITLGNDYTSIWYAEKNWGSWEIFLWKNPSIDKTLTSDEQESQRNIRSSYEYLFKEMCPGYTLVYPNDRITLKCNLSDVDQSVVKINYDSNSKPLSLEHKTEDSKILTESCFCMKESTGTTKVVCKAGCNQICNQECDEYNITNNSGESATFYTCSKENRKNNIWVKYEGINKNTSWQSISENFKTLETGNDKYFKLFNDNDQCYTHTQEEVFEKYNNIFQNAAAAEKKRNFFDDWSDIPAVLSGVSEIVNGEISCDGETGVLGKAWNVLQTIFTLIKIFGIALLIVLSMLDFMKAVTADDAGVMKKATKNAIVRIVIVVVLFMLPALINLILKITYISSGTCGIK